MTAVLLAAAVYSVFRAGRTSALARRVDHGLHALMMMAMIVMLASGTPWPALPQILIFGVASWWFVLRAASRAASRGPGPGAGLRLTGHGKPLYDALAMAAMTYMLAAMDFREAHKISEAAGIMGRAVHHGVGAGVGQLPPSSMDWGTQPALMLAVTFLLASLLWAVRLVKGLRPGTAAKVAAGVRHLSAGRAGGTGDALLEFVGALSMAVMLAALAA
jgi:hypothetical protein